MTFLPTQLQNPLSKTKLAYELHSAHGVSAAGHDTDNKLGKLVVSECIGTALPLAAIVGSALCREIQPDTV